MRAGKVESVFIVDADKKAVIRPVKIGLRLKGRVQILDGVNAGDRIVTEGLQKVRPGAPLSYDADQPPAKRS